MLDALRCKFVSAKTIAPNVIQMHEKLLTVSETKGFGKLSREEFINMIASSPQSLVLINERPQYYSRAETANLLRINLATLYRWTRDGKLKAFKIGSRVLYSAKDIESALTPQSQ